MPRWVIAVFGLLLACGGDEFVSDDDSEGDSGSGGPGPGPAAETCSLAVHRGPSLQGSGRAKRNGSGNLILECGEFEGSTAILEIWVGNGTYEGPGDYPMINDGSRGHVALTLDGGVTYANYSDDLATSCELTVSHAQPNDYPDVGSTVAGSFSCTGLVADGAPDDRIDVEDGKFDLEVY